MLHADQQAIVTQREVGSDTEGYAAALRTGLRQDADVIFVGELLDAETARAALTAAEVGHLVISTMRASGVADTVTRLIDLFPPAEQAQARQSLVATLRGIVSQRLLERADGRGRTPAVEVLTGTAKVVDCIADPIRVHELERRAGRGPVPRHADAPAGPGRPREGRDDQPPGRHRRRRATPRTCASPSPRPGSAAPTESGTFSVPLCSSDGSGYVIHRLSGALTTYRDG